MKTIWKFPLPVTDAFTIEMPRGARLLSVQPQGDKVCLWALVDDAAPKTGRRFVLTGTGHCCDGVESLSFVGTFQVMGGSLVFHVFDAGEVG